MLFHPGRTVATPAALQTMEVHGVSPQHLLLRHVQGDWGDLSEEDQEANADALASGGRLMSSYKMGEETVWVITEWDRSSTTLLMPSEY